MKNDASINIEKTYLTGYDLTMLIPGLGNVYTFQYYEESLDEIVKAMKVNLGLIEPEMTKTFNFSVNYTYEVPVIGKQYYSVKRNEALPSFVDKSLNSLNTWASSRNINVKTIYITQGMDGYDENKDGIVISQNISKGTLVSTINSITVNVIKVDKTVSSENDDNVVDINNSNNVTIENNSNNESVEKPIEENNNAQDNNVENDNNRKEENKDNKLENEENEEN